MQTSPGAPARDPNTPGYEMWSSGQKRQWSLGQLEPGQDVRNPGMEASKAPRTTC